MLTTTGVVLDRLAAGTNNASIENPRTLQVPPLG